MGIEIIGHEFCVLNGNAEAESLHVVNIRYISEQGRYYQISAAVCHHTAERINAGQFTLIVAAVCPFEIVQIDRIGYAEILEGAEQFAVNSFRQTNFSSNAVVKVRQDALAVHTFRSSRQSK